MTTNPTRMHTVESGLSPLDPAVRSRTHLIGHEVRAPLSVMVSVVRRRLSNVSVTRELASDLRLIERTALHMLCILDDVLSASSAKADLHHREAQIAAVDLEDLIEDFQEFGMWVCQEHSNSLYISVRGLVPVQMHIDASAVRQIVYNLLTNAARCCRQGVISVHISCVQRAGVARLKISVSDTGVGLSSEDCVRIKAGLALAGASQRPGLGLKVIRAKLSRLSGSLDLKSRLGRGSVFSVMLPVDVVARAGWKRVDQTAHSRFPTNLLREAASKNSGYLSAKRLQQLSEFADRGELTSILRWIEQGALLSEGDAHASCFLNFIRRAIEALDIEAIALVARTSSTSGSACNTKD